MGTGLRVEDSDRWVIHADLDAFFAAVAVKERPELRGKPVIVGGSPEGRGVVTSATYEARKFGVRSAMPAAQAVRLCPQAVFARVSGESIRWHAGRFREILDNFSPVVEAVSVDEAYLDTGDSRRLYGGGVELARQLKRRVHDELGLVVSIGAASNRLVAKIASDLGKPDGFTVVPHGHEAASLAPLPIERLPGIGPKSAARLRDHGILTLGDLAVAPERFVASLTGSYASSLQERARGEYSKPVQSSRGRRKSLGHGRTFWRDLHGMAEISEPLFGLCQRVGSELRSHRLVSNTVSLKVRYSDFETRSRQRSFTEPTNAHQDLYATTHDLLAELLTARGAPVRMVEVRASGLHPATFQLDLFDPGRQRIRQLNDALDQLESRHGRGIVQPAWVRCWEQAPGKRDERYSHAIGAPRHHVTVAVPSVANRAPNADRS